MNKKVFIVVLIVLVLFSLNFSVAHEIDNATDEELNCSLECDVLSSSDANQSVLKESSKIDTQINVESNTTFDAIGDYFKIRLSDENGKALANSKVTFDVSSKTYAKTTNGKGIASLQINLKDGSYNVTTKFLGNSNYKSSSNTTTIVVKNTRVVDKGLSNSEIQKIIDNAKDKNVILFKGSSYSNINLVVNKRLTLVSNSNTVLKSASNKPAITVKGKNASYTIIKGFNIQDGSAGIVIRDSDFVRIINNEITSKGNGIVATGTKYLNITNNKIVKNSKSGIVVGDTTSTYIFNNILTNNGINGIEVAKSNKVYIHGNDISKNKNNGVYLTKKVNGVDYGEGPKNVYINNNTISKNERDGIVATNAGDNLNIKLNSIVANKDNGISLAHVGSNAIQSNVISENWGNGIQFFDDYIKPENQEISYNAIYSNLHMDVEARDTYYQDYGTKLEVGDNWYTDYKGVCPKIKTNNMKFTVKQIGSNQFQALFVDSNGDVASLLPDRTLKYTVNGGQSISITVRGGAAVFTVDANDKDLIKAIVDNSQRDNKFDSDSKASQPINGVTPSFVYPEIPYGGNGNGNGNGDGSGGNANSGNGSSRQGSSDNTGNSTHSQKSSPSSNANNPINDISQNYETQSTTSPESASDSSNGDAGKAGSESQSVVKQITIEDEDIYRVTGISLIVLLIILTIGLYYREDIKEMNSKR
ncbi:right-handed parallel beta-helix repeat-containing protein [Methanobrevibacter sp.]|uniref:right-handed parallel beta-helix repeat-containing protein n=1 Tax=Methanobrevibacter sp. TaxID=66852 RepID=UPI003863BFFA